MMKDTERKSLILREKSSSESSDDTNEPELSPFSSYYKTKLEKQKIMPLKKVPTLSDFKGTLSRKDASHLNFSISLEKYNREFQDFYIGVNQQVPMINIAKIANDAMNLKMQLLALIADCNTVLLKKWLAQNKKSIDAQLGYLDLVAKHYSPKKTNDKQLALYSPISERINQRFQLQQSIQASIKVVKKFEEKLIPKFEKKRTEFIRDNLEEIKEVEEKEVLNDEEKAALEALKAFYQKTALIKPLTRDDSPKKEEIIKDSLEEIDVIREKEELNDDETQALKELEQFYKKFN